VHAQRRAAQREAARRCKSDWGHNLGKGRVKIPLVATSRVPNAVPLAYTARAVLTVGGLRPGHTGWQGFIQPPRSGGGTPP